VEKSEQITHNNMPSAVGHVWDEVTFIRKQLDEIKSALKPTNFDEYLTRKEVANILKCDESTIHNWSVKGKLTKYCLGNRTYYKRSEVEKALIPIK
jgi:hypothetical protein